MTRADRHYLALMDQIWYFATGRPEHNVCACETGGLRLAHVAPLQAQVRALLETR